MMMTVQYLSPNIAMHLKDFGYTPPIIGAALGCPAILYACTCPFIYIFTSRMKKRGVLIIGFSCITVAMLMIGGCIEVLPFIAGHESQYVFFGLCIIGGAGGLISIPVLPEMMEVYEEDEALMASTERDQVENMVSGLFVTCSSLGEILGPLMSSYLS